MHVGIFIAVGTIKECQRNSKVARGSLLSKSIHSSAHYTFLFNMRKTYFCLYSHILFAVKTTTRFNSKTTTTQHNPLFIMRVTELNKSITEVTMEKKELKMVSYGFYTIESFSFALGLLEPYGLSKFESFE